MMKPLINPTTAVGSSHELFIASTPLRAAKGPPQFLLSAAYSLNVWDLQHFMLVIRSSSPPSLPPQVVVFDFQPKAPDDPFVAIAALSGRPVPGTILVRKMGNMPSRRCWRIGASIVDDPIREAYEFNRGWDTHLQICHHDCRHYTNGLAEVLTGEKCILDRLRGSTA
ncbi:hypothetical protein Droror1_Dr00002981 [Drosera rotundifolia]